MIVYFQIRGMFPAHSKEANQLLEHADLGITGAFIKHSEIVKVTYNDSVTEDRILKTPAILKLAYEVVAGCQDVEVVEFWRTDEPSENGS